MADFRLGYDPDLVYSKYVNRFKQTGLTLFIVVAAIVGLMAGTMAFPACDDEHCDEAPDATCLYECCSLTADLPSVPAISVPLAASAHVGCQQAAGGVLLIPDIFRPPCA